MARGALDGRRLVGLDRRHRLDPRAPRPEHRRRSSSDAWIVGRSPQQDGRALVGHWDGTSWSAVVGLPLPPGVPSELSGVVARNATTSGRWGRISRRARPIRSCCIGTARVGHDRAPGTGLSEVVVVPGSRQAWAVGGSYLGKRLVLDNVLRYRW